MLLDASEFDSIWVCAESVDFRKQMNGLSAYVTEQLKLDVFSKSLFIFRNRRRDAVKIVYWRNTGFAMWQTKLEKETFHWPNASEDGSIEITSHQLDLLLGGVDIKRLKFHDILEYQHIS